MLEKNRKEQDMKRRVAFLASFFVICFAVSLVFSSAALAAGPSKNISAILKAGGGAVGGIGFMVMTGMSKVVKDEYKRMDFTVVPGGWVGNLPRTDKGEMDLASTTVAMCSLAVAKKEPFPNPLPNIRALYSTQDKLYYFAIVKKELPVDSLRELFDKKPAVKLCTINKGTTTEMMWRNVFESQGSSWEDVAKWGGKMNFVAWGDAVNLVKDGHADGILAVGAASIGWAMDLSNSRAMKILKWDDEMLGALNKHFGFDKGFIPGKTYPGIDEDVVCPADQGEIIVNAKVPDDVVTAILTAIADNADQYAKYHSGLAGFTAKGMAKSLLLPLHPAALKFYKSRGIPTP
jgi:TRAP transporter TAXI family solute receptor